MLMQHQFKNYKISRLITLALITTLTAIAAPTQAEINTIQFDLENVWLKPDISHPRDPAQPMTGSFEWTYTVGDFENGTGEFKTLDTPWYNPGIAELKITFDLKSIEFSLIGNYHDRGVDITLFLDDPFSPDHPVDVDLVRSKFDIQYGVSYQGHAISGSVAPVFDLDLEVTGSCPSSLQINLSKATPHGNIAILYSTGKGSLVIPNHLICPGTTLGLNNKAKLGTTITADQQGNATLNTKVPPGACGNIFLQALDLNDCTTSNVALLQ